MYKTFLFSTLFIIQASAPLPLLYASNLSSVPFSIGSSPIIAQTNHSAPPLPPPPSNLTWGQVFDQIGQTIESLEVDGSQIIEKCNSIGALCSIQETLKQGGVDLRTYYHALTPDTRHWDHTLSALYSFINGLKGGMDYKKKGEIYNTLNKGLFAPSICSLFKEKFALISPTPLSLAQGMPALQSAHPSNNLQLVALQSAPSIAQFSTFSENLSNISIANLSQESAPIHSIYSRSISFPKEEEVQIKIEKQEIPLQMPEPDVDDDLIASSDHMLTQIKYKEESSNESVNIPFLGDNFNQNSDSEPSQNAQKNRFKKHRIDTSIYSDNDTESNYSSDSEADNEQEDSDVVICDKEEFRTAPSDLHNKKKKYRYKDKAETGNYSPPSTNTNNLLLSDEDESDGSPPPPLPPRRKLPARSTHRTRNKQPKLLKQMTPLEIEKGIKNSFQHFYDRMRKKYPKRKGIKKFLKDNAIFPSKYRLVVDGVDKGDIVFYEINDKHPFAELIRGEDLTPEDAFLRISPSSVETELYIENGKGHRLFHYYPSTGILQKEPDLFPGYAPNSYRTVTRGTAAGKLLPNFLEEAKNKGYKRNKCCYYPATKGNKNKFYYSCNPSCCYTLVKWNNPYRRYQFTCEKLAKQVENFLKAKKNKNYREMRKLQELKTELKKEVYNTLINDTLFNSIVVNASCTALHVDGKSNLNGAYKFILIKQSAASNRTLIFPEFGMEISGHDALLNFFPFAYHGNTCELEGDIYASTILHEKMLETSENRARESYTFFFRKGQKVSSRPIRKIGSKNKVKNKNSTKQEVVEEQQYVGNHFKREINRVSQQEAKKGPLQKKFIVYSKLESAYAKSTKKGGATHAVSHTKRKRNRHSFDQETEKSQTIQPAPFKKRKKTIKNGDNAPIESCKEVIEVLLPIFHNKMKRVNENISDAGSKISMPDTFLDEDIRAHITRRYQKITQSNKKNVYFDTITSNIQANLNEVYCVADYWYKIMRYICEKEADKKRSTKVILWLLLSLSRPSKRSKERLFVPFAVYHHSHFKRNFLTLFPKEEKKLNAKWASYEKKRKQIGKKHVNGRAELSCTLIFDIYDVLSHYLA